jgi:glycosyltransferase involved in cell wall biosynthesis
LAADSADRVLRVLSVAHTAVSRSAGRLRYHPLARDKSLEIKLVVPSRWHQFGRWLEAEPPTDPGISVTKLPIRLPRVGSASWYLHVYPGLGQLAAGFSPDVIHLWEEPWSFVALHATALARRHRAALVLEVDQNILKRLPPPFEGIRRYVLRRTDLVLARSNDAAAVVRACGYAGPTLPIGYGVDQAVFHPCAARASGPRFKLGYVGRLVVEKGLDDVIAAMARAKADVELTIIGEGRHEAALRAHAQAAGVADRVSFRPWTVPVEVAAFLRGLHALVLPTRTSRRVKEQFGRVIIEAQACGTPIIGSTSGSIPDVVGDGGWIVPQSDPAALANLLEHLAVSPNEVRERGRAGLANVAARFTFPAVAADLARGWRAAHTAHLTRVRRTAARRSPRASVEAGQP